MASGVDKRNLEHVIQLYQEHILKYGIGNNRFLEYRHFKSFMQERFNPDQLNLEISTDQSLWSQICFNTFKMTKSVMGVSRSFFLFVCFLILSYMTAFAIRIIDLNAFYCHYTRTMKFRATVEKTGVRCTVLWHHKHLNSFNIKCIHRKQYCYIFTV